jgi:hypothetical protein
MSEMYVQVLTVLILRGEVSKTTSEPSPELLASALNAFRGAMKGNFVRRSPVVRIVNTDKSYPDEKISARKTEIKLK